MEKWAWIRSYLKDMRWFVTHIYREGNSSADKLAPHDRKDTFHWWDQPPIWVNEFLEKDRCDDFYRI